MIYKYCGILGFPPGKFQLWELEKMVTAKMAEAFDLQVLAIGAAFQGGKVQNPYRPQIVLPWQGWGAYNIK
ncbi:MAG: hypothetical protein Q4C70_11680 [Planctomycetia bacterium]|nr:hypothetical protein [Planctomycetia bacterium]